MRNRWYEPNAGRFLSEDPIGLAGGINLYAFAGGDPVNNYDPTGTACWRVTIWQTTTTYARDGTIKVMSKKLKEWTECDDDGGRQYRDGIGLGGGSGAGGAAGSGRGTRVQFKAKQQRGEATAKRLACARAALEFVAAAGIDVGLVYLYSTGMGLLFRGAVLYARGGAIASGLIHTTTLAGVGSAGVTEVLNARVLMGLGSASTLTTYRTFSIGGVSAIPGANTVNFFRRGGFAACGDSN